MRKRYILLSIVLFMILFIFAWTAPVLMQEDNTVSVLSGIVKLSVSEAEIVKYDHDDSVLYYISKSTLDEKLIESVLPYEGYVLSEQMGSGYIFSKEKDPSRKVVVISTQFTRFYRIWKIPEDQEG